ncbi:Sn1-specific diacylglycerol lipase alpha [Trifolium pratense]|uniref:Sn1-specific diacylglycerol lipase alpha n=4 Tax=Trifolium TaxID=3898 RepID=A0A2K3LZ75_TRIPR|nr:Sn1-specific diacylglycerol lipase alpha [Trifolium pratense]
MKRAKSMAQAAWTRPNLNLTSWSCIGPRRRATGHSNSKEDGCSPSSSASDNAESSEPLIFSPRKGINAKSLNLPVSSSVDEWSTEIECENESNADADIDNDLHLSENMIDHERYEDQMSEVELWQQLEHELYDRPEGEEADVAKEIREEEEAATTEVVGQTRNSSAPEVDEVHRFYPPGKIMHIVTLHSDSTEIESDGSRTSSTSSDDSEQIETKIGIFLTSRSLYSKLRLSQTMISDHFMPIYRKQIERLIKELEEESIEDRRTQEVML